MPAQPAEPSTRAPDFESTTRPPRGRHDSAKRHGQNDDLQGFGHQYAGDLGADESARAERCDVESPQDAVAALEARRDRQGDQ